MTSQGLAPPMTYSILPVIYDSLAKGVQMAIAFGILCGEYGQDELLDAGGSDLDSPTVRMALLPVQERKAGRDRLYESVVIGYLPRFERQKRSVEAAVQRQGGRRWAGKVSFVPLPYADEEDGPHDLDKTHAALTEVLEEVASGGPGNLIYLHLNSGTQVQQWNLYRMADRQLLSCPARLLQTFARREDPTKEIGYRVPHLGLYRYRAPEPTDQADLEALEHIRKAFGSANAEFESALPLLARIGTRTGEPLLLLGGTGTGKTYLAFQIHQAWLKRQGISTKAEKCFHEVNCASHLTPEMAHSEIFGHVKGAYTGAHKRRTGKMKLADKGTLFLDEIGDLNLAGQGMLLKAIEDHKFQPLGSETTVSSNFRLICATNRDLSAEVAGWLSRGGPPVGSGSHGFRHDLYFRISSWSFNLPSLRQRADLPERVRLILDTWYQENAGRYGLKGYRRGFDFSVKAWAEFMSFVEHPDSLWPGNIRELRDFVCRIAVRSGLTGAHDIQPSVVRNEIARLRTKWQGLQRIPGQDALRESVCDAASKAYPEHCLAEAVELWLQNEVRHHSRTNADAGRELYLPPGGSLPNPGAKLSARRKTLLGRAISGEQYRRRP